MPSASPAVESPEILAPNRILRWIRHIDLWDKSKTRELNRKFHELKSKTLIKIISFGLSPWILLYCGVILTIMALVADEYYDLSLYGGAMWQGTILFVIIKFSVKRERPYLQDAAVTRLDRQTTHYGFPSGHAFFYILALTFFWFFYSAHPAVLGVILGGSVLVGLTRLYLGVHYPTDIIMGILVGFGSNILYYFGTHYWFVHFFYLFQNI
jgi:membrane-associated phospholipid phosphatase